MARITRIEAKADQLPLRERNKQRVRQRILSAASELFKTRGHAPTTMENIAEKAEISRATLFNNSPSKEALLLPWGRELREPTRTEGEAERIVELVHNGIECLGFVVDLPEDLDDSAAVVRTIRGFVDRIREGVDLPRPYADRAQAAVVLGSLWGDELCRAFGWEWVYLEYDRGLDTWGVVSPDRSYACYPHLILVEKLTHPESDNTIMLLFNMIGAGNLPASSPGKYTMLR